LLSKVQLEEIVDATGPTKDRPGLTFSDIRTRLYPAALAQVFPDKALTFKQLIDVAKSISPSPVLEDK
jgi:hypothetical protein